MEITRKKYLAAIRAIATNEDASHEAKKALAIIAEYKNQQAIQYLTAITEYRNHNANK